MLPIVGMTQSSMRSPAPEQDADTSFQGPSLAALMLAEGSDDTTAQAAQALLTIAQSPRYRMELVDQGAIELLLTLLPNVNAAKRRCATDALQQFALDKRMHTRFQSAKAVSTLLERLENKATDQGDAAAMLSILHCLLTCPALRMQFVLLDGISTMAQFVLQGSVMVKERASFVLWMLAAIPTIQPYFLNTKAIPALISTLDENQSDCDLIDTSLGTLALLAEADACRVELIAHNVLNALPHVLLLHARDEVTSRAHHLQTMLRI